MIQRGSNTSFTNLWSLLLYIQSLWHYIENAQENKKNTILSYNIAENSKRVKRNEEKACVCVCMDLVYNYFIWSMIQRGSDTSFTNLWSLLLYIQSLLHYIENAQENKKNTILSYNIAENSKRVKRNEEKVYVCVCMDAGWCLVSTLND